MKTLFYSLLSVAFMLSTFPAEAISIPQTDGLGPKITISIELGKRSRGCESRGLCRTSISGSMDSHQSGPSGENTATGTAWIENGKLKIEFNRASMTEATYQTHFSGGYFQLEEDYALPSEVASALGVRSYTLKTGKYYLPKSLGESNNVPVTF